MFSPGRKSFSRIMHPAKTLNGSLPALSGLSILTHKNKKRGNTMNFNPNGASDVTVDLENNRPPANMLERLLRTWPEMDRSRSAGGPLAG